MSQNKKARKQQEEAAADSDTIKISSDEEQTTEKTINTGSVASHIYTLGSNVASFAQRNRCRTPSRSPCESSSSSAISFSLRSLDYEAEADEEDANECEGMELQRKLAGGNDNLMHVQNFLNYFDGQQQRQQGKQKPSAICCVTQLKEEMLRQQEQHNVDKYVAIAVTEPNQLSVYVEPRAVNELLTPQQQQLDFVSTTVITTATSALATTITPTTTASAAKVSSKPCKFTISTKFLRKPRHKLKSVNLAPTADVNNVLAKTTTTVATDKVLQALQEQQQLNGNKQLLLQQEQQQQSQQQRQQSLYADEPNVKFNSNFSINSLLNKK
uniref:Uncharacterized protein n=1 Tax=Zeugodacus cucurbitae TaxID=28588 RepID=A0A0A1X743_ZEUCU